MSVLTVSSPKRSLKIVTSTLTALALALTVYRLILRCVARKLWWEDACAFVALIGSIIWVVSGWLALVKSKSGEPSIIWFRMYILTYPFVVWSVRLSILLSISRIVSPSQNCRRAMVFVAGSFVSTWISLTIMFIWKYMAHRSWYTTPISSSRVASLGRPMAIFELTTDVISDITLIILPIRLLQSVKLPPCQRRLIIAAFSSCIIITIASFFRTACQVFHMLSLISTAIDIEVAFSLFVCNSLVISTRVYRMTRRNGTANDAHSSNSCASAISTAQDTPQFTTIDLTSLGGSISADHLPSSSHGDEAVERLEGDLALEKP
ncbi:hypothetical protein PAXRUDRAFT_32702 [Paxillus rubicundulus Ve08.2h10]|uniref:Unplaced genomic scaffold scaffold_189, whole genome shotgun sequence n=1 Tax=Paxillus rubicundulus Ve08.2h10 TaxID=930991 RepID=A0A0D0DS01_9AGAM|nr:hypothetical protein PAXRUDRAFT_32702 [Paxillus rubicundulus Ve08.2h10]